MDLALALVLEGNNEAAEALLRDVLTSDPDQEEAHSLLGRILTDAFVFRRRGTT